MPTSGVPNTTKWDPLKAGSYSGSMVRRMDTSYIMQRPKRSKEEHLGSSVSSADKHKSWSEHTHSLRQWW